MKCNNCQSIIEDGKNYCTNCGAKLNDIGTNVAFVVSLAFSSFFPILFVLIVFACGIDGANNGRTSPFCETFDIKAFLVESILITCTIVSYFKRKIKYEKVIGIIIILIDILAIIAFFIL